jgi:hypothetical protein
MDAEVHFRKLEHLYQVAPVSRWYGTSIRVGDGRAEVRVPVRPEFFHAAGAVHGSVYFRALDGVLKAGLEAPPAPRRAPFQRPRPPWAARRPGPGGRRRTSGCP